MIRNRSGQSAVELSVLFTFVIAALVFMGFYLQRGVQGGVKSNSDSLGQQFSTEKGWTQTSTNTSKQALGSPQTDTTSESTYSQTLGP